jgi:hypothetical protein
MTDLTVCRIFGIEAVKGDLGLEIEVEGDNLPDYLGGYWRAVIDNSLRGGMEYIFDRPLTLPEADKAITQLKNTFKEFKSKLSFSFRTSTHVHVNVCELKYSSLLNMIYTYLILEGPMMEYCGEIRKNNRFCLRLQDAANLLTVLESVFKDTDGKRYNRIPANMVRYASINLEALAKFGSLEFRGMRGTLDSETILTWCGSLLALRTFSETIDNPMQVYNLYMELGPEKFMEKVLGSYHQTYWTDKAAAQMDANFLECLSLPFTYEQSLEVKEEKVDKHAGIMAEGVVPEDIALVAFEERWQQPDIRLIFRNNRVPAPPPVRKRKAPPPVVNGQAFD